MVSKLYFNSVGASTPSNKRAGFILLDAIVAMLIVASGTGLFVGGFAHDMERQATLRQDLENQRKDYDATKSAYLAWQEAH